MWGKLHRELIVITIISVLILAVSFAFNFSASQKDILERQTYDYLLDAAHHTKVILHTEIQRQNELLDIVLRNAPRYEGQKDNLINLLSTVSNTGHFFDCWTYLSWSENPDEQWRGNQYPGSGLL